MVIAVPERPMVVCDRAVDIKMPSPLFNRLDRANGCRIVVEIVGCDEDLQSIGSLPTFDGAIDWKFRRVEQAGEPEALFTLVIWSASFDKDLPRSLVESRPASCVLIAHRFPDAPPKSLNGRLTSRLPFEDSVRSVVRMLIPSLVIPVAFEGLICVDYADMVLAINRGGAMRQFVRHSDDVQSVAGAILQDSKDHLKALGPEASVCVGILAESAALTWRLVDGIIGEMLRILHPDILLVVSAAAHPGGDAWISVLTSSGDSKIEC